MPTFRCDVYVQLRNRLFVVDASGSRTSVSAYRRVFTVAAPDLPLARSVVQAAVADGDVKWAESESRLVDGAHQITTTESIASVVSATGRILIPDVSNGGG